MTFRGLDFRLGGIDRGALDHPGILLRTDPDPPILDLEGQKSGGSDSTLGCPLWALRSRLNARGETQACAFQEGILLILSLHKHRCYTRGFYSYPYPDVNPKGEGPSVTKGECHKGGIPFVPGPAHAGFATGRDPPIGGWVSFSPPDPYSSCILA